MRVSDDNICRNETWISAYNHKRKLSYHTIQKGSPRIRLPRSYCCDSAQFFAACKFALDSFSIQSIKCPNKFCSRVWHWQWRVSFGDRCAFHLPIWSRVLSWLLCYHAFCSQCWILNAIRMFCKIVICSQIFVLTNKTAKSLKIAEKFETLTNFEAAYGRIFSNLTFDSEKWFSQIKCDLTVFVFF